MKQKQITIRDIARLSGCSVSTVSRAMNNSHDISDETKERIQRIMDEHGYVPNNSARNLKRKDSNTIAIIVKGISNPFFTNTYTMFEHHPALTPYTLTLQQVDQNEDEALVALRAEKEKKVCGTIFFGGYFDDSKQANLKKLTVPYVMCTARVADDVPATDYSAIGIDDELESYKVVKYLLSLGHKKIAIIAGRQDDQNIGLHRLKGYRRALEESGIAYDEKLVYYMEDDIPAYTPENGYVVANKLLDSGEDFTALYVISDNTCYGACKAILSRGKKIPDDIAVASFDGLDMSKYYYPSLTTMKQPCREMVDAVVNQLIGLMNGTVDHVQKNYPALLIEGQSTKALKK